MVRGFPKHPGLPLTFSGNPIEIGEKFLAILVPVNESEITNSTTPEFKIGENSAANVPEVAISRENKNEKYTNQG